VTAGEQPVNRHGLVLSNNRVHQLKTVHASAPFVWELYTLLPFAEFFDDSGS
jgi:hypothetical protein